MVPFQTIPPSESFGRSEFFDSLKERPLRPLFFYFLCVFTKTIYRFLKETAC